MSPDEIPDAAVLACIQAGRGGHVYRTIEEIPPDVVLSTRQRLAAALPLLLDTYEKQLAAAADPEGSP